MALLNQTYIFKEVKVIIFLNPAQFFFFFCPILCSPQELCILFYKATLSLRQTKGSFLLQSENSPSPESNS